MTNAVDQAPVVDSGDLLEVALIAHESGLPVLPPREDGSKAPINVENGSWKPAQSHMQTEEEVRAWYGSRQGIGYVCGSISGNLETIDFDDRATYEECRQVAIASGFGDLIDRIESGYLEETPTEGIHWPYKCKEISRNTKLARRPKRPEEKLHHKDDVKVLIETRGEGGYIVVAPSSGPVHHTGQPYVLLAGGPATIATITADERRTFWTLAQSFDEMPAHEQVRQPSSAPENVDLRPGDDFGSRADWLDILQPHGWRHAFQRGEIGYWCRPGKERGISATTGYGGDYLYVFSTSTEFESERAYSKFSAYTQLEHGGDFHAAAKELSQKGYGNREHTPSPPSQNGSKPQEWPDASFRLTDLGNGQRFINANKRDVRYCLYHPHPWMVYLGGRWKGDDDGEVRRKAKRVALGIYGEASGVDGDDSNSKKRREAIIKHPHTSQSASRQRAMLEMAWSEPGVAVTPNQLDANNWLLNVADKTINLKTCQPYDQKRTDLLTKQAPVVYKNEATCPIWEAFLVKNFEGKDVLIRFIKRAVGYSLTGETSEEVFFILYGTGANGKTTLIETVAAMLGDYAQLTDFSTFLHKEHDSIRNDLAMLKGARFVSAVESQQGRRLDEVVVKQLAGGDRITCRYLHREFFQYIPTFKIWLATNHKPDIRGTDHAIWRRVRLVPFNVRIPDEDQDKALKSKLRAELPGILNWALDGLKEWRSNGLGYPDEIRDATKAYRSEMDPLEEFLTDATFESGDGHATRRNIWKSYLQWCDENGQSKIGPKRFTQELVNRGFSKKRVGSDSKRGFLGLKLLPGWPREEN